MAYKRITKFRKDSKDLTGQTFGRLTALYLVYVPEAPPRSRRR